MRPGDLIEVQLRRIVHGGAVLGGIVADADRRTVFVRHGLPGETGSAVVTGLRRGGRIIFADLVQVAGASEHRVPPRCPASGPGGCGGCDFQHVAIDEQRVLKAEVLADSLRRTGRLDADEVGWDGLVHPVPGDQDGLRWRTRSRFWARGGELAMRARGSHDLVAVTDCPIAADQVVAAARQAVRTGSQGEVLGLASSTGEVVAGPVESVSGTVVHEAVAGQLLQVGATGFWQVHRGAPAVLVEAVAEALDLRGDDVLLDLYGGVGLFAAALGSRAGRTVLVEGDRAAARHARANLQGLVGARVQAADVGRWLAGYRGPADAVVLDPPRTGAGAGVLGELHRLRPRVVAYVACDPVALARDLRTAVDLGWRVVRLRAFDLFPMTHHVEGVATLLPPDGGG